MNNNKTNYNQLYQNFSPKIQYKTQPFSFYNQNNQSQSSNNKISYNPNIISNQNNFQNPKNPIKWRNINKINLSHLKNSRDINILQSYLDNLICGQISEEDIQSIQESSIVKLIQILQTMSDILLIEQAELENEKLKLESDNVNLMKDFQKNDKKNLKYKEAINRLKKEKRRDMGVINTYLNVLNNLKQGTYYHKENYNISDIDINQKKFSNINRATNINQPQKDTGEFKCEFCINKTFPNEFELTKHLEEVHGINKNMPIYPMYQGQNQPQEKIQYIKPEVTVNVPDNLYGINNINNAQPQNNEEILKEFKKEKEMIIQKINEEKLRIQQDNEQARNSQQNIIDDDYLNKFENTLKETFDNFKKQQNNINNQNINQYIEIEDDEEEKRKLKEIQELKEQLENEQKKAEKKKLDYESESKKYESIYLEIIQMKKFSEDAPSQREIKFSTNSNIQQVGAKLEYLGQNNNKSSIDNIKIFNSGKLESDHDDTDEENEKNKELINMYKNNYQELVSTIQQKFIQNPPPPKEEKKSKNDDDIIEIKETNKIEKNNLIENPPKLKQKKKNKDLDKYYKKYTKRDENYIKSNSYNDYLIETIPENYELNDDIDIDELLEDKTKQAAMSIFPKNLKLNFEIEEDQMKEESINNLYDLTNNLIIDMDKKNPENKFVNKYYQSVMDMLGFKQIQKDVKKIKDKLNKEKEKENIIDNTDKKENDKNLKDTVINSIKIEEKKEENELKKSIPIDNDDIKEIKIDNDKKEIKDGIEITEFIMEPTDKKEDETKLKTKPNEKEKNKVNDEINNKINIEKIPEIKDDNKINNVQPSITIKKETKEETIIVQSEDIKENNKELNKPEDNNLETQKINTNNNNTNITINNNENSLLPSIQIKTEEKKEEKPEEKKEEIKEEIKESSIVIPKNDNNNILSSNMINSNMLNSNIPSSNTLNNNNIEYNTINQNINQNEQPNVKYTYYQGNIIQQNIPNNSDSNKTNNNQGYNSNMANNTNFDIAYNSVTGPKLINNSDENKDKDKNQNFTSTMTNNNNNTENNQGNVGFSDQQGIYSQIKSEENKNDTQVKSNKLKESEMVEEPNENEEKKNENNNNNQIIKESTVINGNDKSMEFDKYLGKK